MESAMPPDSPEPTPAADARGADNAIEPARRRRTRADAIDLALEPEAKPVALTRPGDLPDAVARRYFGEPARFGGFIDYYEGQGAKHPAFRDRGDRLHALQTDPATVATLLAIADHRNWRAIEVRGDDDFRREVWREAQTLGLDVRGYKPTARDREELERTGRGAAPAPSGPPSADARPAPRSRSAARDGDDWVVGKVVELGEAPYQRREGAKASPFLRLERPDGQTVELWGVGLPDALKHAQAQVGDSIRIRRDGTDRVTVTTQDRDPATGAIVRERREVDRNRWVAEAERFRAAGPEQRARDPALAGAQSRLDMVNSVARARLRDPDARARVSAAAEDRIADHIAVGRRFERAPEAERDRRGRDPEGPERVRGR
jgi:hypothetical protein